jgi:3-methyladenine DNA glycosylase AlkD
MHPHHRELLREIKKKAGEPVRDPFLENYLGNPHPLYVIKSAALRKILRTWLAEHLELTPMQLAAVVTSLVRGKTSTEKCAGGLLLDCARKSMRGFDPKLFDRWLTPMIGWVEVDSLCTGRYPEAEIPREWSRWKAVLNRLSRSSNIQKRRASLVLLCSPLRHSADPRLLKQALTTVSRLSGEREVLITKAISWVLRSASVHYPNEIRKYITLNKEILPAIAVRETMTKISTGKKTKRKAS